MTIHLTAQQHGQRADLFLAAVCFLVWLVLRRVPVVNKYLI